MSSCDLCVCQYISSLDEAVFKYDVALSKHVWGTCDALLVFYSVLREYVVFCVLEFLLIVYSFLVILLLLLIGFLYLCYSDNMKE